MLVHVALPQSVVHVHDTAIGLLLLNQPFQAAANVRRVLVFVEVVMAGGLHREDRQGGLGRAVFAARVGARTGFSAAARRGHVEAVRPPMAVGRLMPGEPVEAQQDCFFRLVASAEGADPLLSLRVFSQFGDGPLQRIENRAVVLVLSPERGRSARRGAVQQEHDRQRGQKPHPDGQVGQQNADGTLRVLRAGIRRCGQRDDGRRGSCFRTVHDS